MPKQTVDPPTTGSPTIESLRPPTALHDVAAEHLQVIHRTVAGAATFRGTSGWVTAGLGVVALVVSALTWRLPAEEWLTWWAILGPIAFAIGAVGVIAKTRGSTQPLWGPAGRRFLLGLLPSLAAGAVLSLVLLRLGHIELLPGVWLLTFGLGITACGLASTRIVPAMGISFLLLAPLALFEPSWGRALLAIGFGGFQLMFGVLIARQHGG